MDDSIDKLFVTKQKHVTRSDEEVEELKTYKGLDFKLWSDDKSFLKVLDRIAFTELEWVQFTKRGKPNKLIGLRMMQLHTLVYNLYTLNDKVLSISRKPEFYSQQSLRYRKHHVTKLIIKVVDEMVAAGLVEQHKGTKDIETGIGFTTKLKPTDRLLEIFKDINLKIPSRIPKGVETMVLRSKKENTFHIADGSRVKVTKGGELLPYKDTPWINERRKMLKKFNEWVATSTYLIDGKVPEGSTSSTRVFNNASWDHGGRYYSNFWTNLPEATRSRLTIDGEKVVELDFQACFISICYALKRLPVPQADPYDIPGFSRKDIKQVSMRCFGGASYDSVLSELVFTDCIHQADDALDLFLAKHAAISDWFFDKAILTLMRWESKITSKVVQWSRENKIQCLPIHDGYICKTGDMEKLRTRMSGAFKWVLVSKDCAKIV